MLYDFKSSSSKRGTKSVKILTLISVSLGVFFLVLAVRFLPEIPTSNPSLFDQQKKEVLKNPFRPEPHFQLAQLYLENNNLESAKKELLLALNLDPDYQKAKDLEKEIENQEKGPQRIKAEIQEWEKVLEEKPDYRDAYLQIAVLNWQIYKETEAREAVNKALELDPNFEAGKKFKKFLAE